MNETALATQPRADAGALAVYGKIDNPQGFCESMAKTFAALTGCTLDQGAAVALTCLCERLTPLDFIRRYHIIQGKPTMRADAMLAEFRMNWGGDYEIISRMSDLASIKLFHRGREYTFSFSLDDAKQSRWPWTKDKGPGDEWKADNLKDNWETPTDWKNMLWARLISDSLRAVCPEMVAGVYTPEEMQDVIDVEPSRVTIEQHRPTAAEIIQQQATHPVDEADGNVLDAEFTKGDADLTPATNGEVHDDDPAPGTITAGQREEINELVDRLRMPADELSKVLRKRGVASVRSLSKEQAKDIIDRLRPKLKLEAAGSPN